MDDGLPEIYCPVCGSCGDDLCCPPQLCKHKSGCLYPSYENGLWIKISRPFYKYYLRYKNYVWQQRIKKSQEKNNGR